MEDKRYLERINWNFDNYHKFDKCYCQSKTYYCNHDKGSTEDNEFDEADTYNIKYYNSKDVKQKQKNDNRNKHSGQEINTHNCKDCACHLLQCLDTGTLVDVFLAKGGNFLNVFFLYFDKPTSCAYFLQIGAAAMPIIIDCERIEAIRKT